MITLWSADRRPWRSRAPLPPGHPEWFTGMKLMLRCRGHLHFCVRCAKSGWRERRSRKRASRQSESGSELSLCVRLREKSDRVPGGSSRSLPSMASMRMWWAMRRQVAPCEAAWEPVRTSFSSAKSTVMMSPTPLAYSGPGAGLAGAAVAACRGCGFLIVGPNCSPRLNSQSLPERVVVTGAVDDLTPFYDSARVFVAPTQAGGGNTAQGRSRPRAGECRSWRPHCWSRSFVGTAPAEILAADGGGWEFADACVALCTDETRWKLQRRRRPRQGDCRVFARRIRRASFQRALGRRVSRSTLPNRNDEVADGEDSPDAKESVSSPRTTTPRYPHPRL